MSLLSALLLSFDDVVAEAAMSAPNAPTSQQVTARMGSAATLLCGSYVVRCRDRVSMFNSHLVPQPASLLSRCLRVG